MSVPLKAIVGDLQIVSGARQPAAAPAAKLQAPRGAAHGRASDRLFVLVELHSTDPGAPIEPHNRLYSEIIEQVSAGYWHTRGSTTAALREAISTANNWLLDYNLESQVRERYTAGITCVVMRESDVFIAQAGPSACYVAHQGQVERFPKRAVTSPALGTSRGCEIRYGHAELHHGDVILLCDSITAERTADGTIANAVVYVGAPVALTNLERLAGAGDLIALIIESSAADEPSQADTTAVTTPPPPVVEPELMEPVKPDKVSKITHPPEPGPSLRERLSETWRQVRRPITAARQAFPRAELQERARQMVRSLVIGLIVAVRGAQELFRRILPEPAEERPPRNTLGNTLIMAGLAILIPLLITLLVVNIYIQRRQQVEFESLLNSTRAEIGLAQTAPELQAARTHWQLAWQHIREALDYQPDHPDVLALREQIQEQLDQMDRVTRVRASLLLDCGPGSGYRLITQGANVFVMNSSHFWHVTLNETGTALLESQNSSASAYTGVAVGDRQIGDLLDMTWAGAQGQRTKRSLLILDTGGLLEYDPAWNIRTVALGQQDGLRPGMRLMASFGGNLYVMDDSQLWRYKPVGDGFGTVPEAYFNASPGNLSPVIDLAIDGSVYLLYPDGYIRKFFGGDEQVFTPTDLPDPLARAVGLAVDAETVQGSLYVADAGHARVAQLTPQGIFIRQLKAHGDAMDALESIFVDQRAQRLFFLSDGRLYIAPLPPRPDALTTNEQRATSNE